MNLLRHAILLQLEAADPATLPLGTIRTGLRLAGHNVSENQLQTQINYLAEKTLLAATTPLLDHAHPRYHLTAQGRDYLESQHLI